ncbi:hypothetical protein [Bartonella sp. B39]
MKGKNSASYKESHSFSCREPLVFSLKNYKIVLRSFFIMFCVSSIMMVLEVPACAKSLAQSLQGWSGVGHVIFFLPVLIWLCLFTPFPILWGIHSIRERKLKKMVKKVEEATKQQDQSDRG